MKAGWKTTEFWLTVLGNGIALATMAAGPCLSSSEAS